MKILASQPVLVDGKVIGGSQLQEYATRLGLCQICAEHKTHKKAGSILNRSWEPLTIIDETGIFTVYKGYCLQPTCYTFFQAQELLGERTPRKSRRRRKKHISRGVGVTKSTSSIRSASTAESLPSAPPSQPSPARVSPPSATRQGTLRETAGANDTIRQVDSPKERPRASWESAGIAEESPRSIIQVPSKKPPPSLPGADFFTIVAVLKAGVTDAKVVRNSLESLREAVVYAHVYHSAAGSVLSPGWMKVVASAVELHQQDPQVVSQAALLCMTLSSLSVDYTYEIQTSGGLEMLMSVLQLHDADEGVQERCCAALLECLEGLDDTTPVPNDLVTVLVSLLTDPNVWCCEMATICLLRLHLSRDSGVPSQATIVCDALVSSEGDEFLWELLETATATTQAKHAAMFLLWSLSVTTNCASQNGGAVVTPTEANVWSAVKVLRDCDSPFVMEAACGFLASTPLRNHAFHQEELLCILPIIYQALRKVPSWQGVQIQGVLALSNLLGDDSSALTEELQEELVSITLEAMHHCGEVAELLSAGCRLVAFACETYEGPRRVVASSDSAATLLQVCHSSITGYGLTSNSCSRQTYLAAISVLRALSSSAAASEKLNRARVVLDAIHSMEFDDDPIVLASLQRIILNLLPRVSTERESLAQSNPSSSSQLIYCILDVLERVDTKIVHRDSGALLGLLYSKFESGADDQHSSVMLVGSEPLTLQRNYRQELEAIESVILAQLDDCASLETGCASLFNFWSALLNHQDDAVMAILADLTINNRSRLLDLALDVMTRHKTHAGVLFQVARLLMVSTIAFKNEPTGRECRIVEQIVESMSCVTDDTELMATLCGVLNAFMTQVHAGYLVDAARIVSTLVRMLRLDDVNAVTKSSQALATLLQNDFDACRYLASLENEVSNIVWCMEEHPSTDAIAEALCSVVESLVLQLSPSSRQTFTDLGGLEVLICTLGCNPKNARLVKSTCAAVTVLLAGIKNDVLWMMRIALSEAVANSLEHTLSCLDTQVAVVDLLQTLCFKEDFFRLLLAGCAPSLLATMAEYPVHASLHKSASAIIRLITSSEENIGIVGTSETVKGVVNSMLAHPESIELVLECLTTLNYLGTERSARKHLRRLCVEDACFHLLQINLENDNVVAAALACLNNIAVDMKSQTVSPMKDGVLQLIVLAMQLHPASQVVNEHACLILKTYSYDPKSFGAIKNRSDELVSLLVASAEAYPEECGDRATYIMHKLF